MLNKKPPIAPSTDLLGLILGIRACLKKCEPNKYAPISPDYVTNNKYATNLCPSSKNLIFTK